MNAALEKAPHLRIQKFNKRRGAYLSKYGTDHWTFVARKKNHTNSSNSTLLYLRVRQEGKKRGPGNKVTTQIRGIKLT